MSNLSDDDLDSFFDGADQANKPSDRRLETLRQEIKSSNPLRWLSLRRDLHWLKKEMKKRGMNPDDARWLIP